MEDFNLSEILEEDSEEMQEGMQEEMVKYNLLAANRGSKYCMTPIVAIEGKVLISSDVTSGEPTLILNYSNDSTLYEILYNMRDKKPYWNNNGLLMTDSLYITTLSKSELLNKFLTNKFIEEYYLDSEKAKGDKVFKKNYKIAKVTCVREGTLILTSNGLKPIESISLNDKIFDGVKYVTHSGIYINDHEKPTERVDDCYVTRSHKVFTKGGWKTSSNLKKDKVEVLKSNIGWSEVWGLFNFIWRYIFRL